jgi:hypothetical protein
MFLLLVVVAAVAAAVAVAVAAVQPPLMVALVELQPVWELMTASEMESAKLTALATPIG